MAALDALTPGVWNVDPSHSTLGFSARHLVVAKVRGRFTDFSGVITIAENPLESSVAASAAVGSITTNDEQRDGHLKSGDFLDIETYPTLTLKSTSIRQDGSDYVLVADLTIKDVTKSVEFELEFEGVAKDPWGGTRAGFSAETEINRKDFGMEWNVALEAGGVLVGEKVKIQLDIEAVQA
jgi:polyisoprenoid-binding protein YceI